MKRKGSRRGIYLISTLLLLTFLVMVGGAVMVSFQQGLASSTSYTNRQMALQAAMSGLQYLEARMESASTNYSPSDAPAVRTYETSDGSFAVSERGYTSGSLAQGWNVVGFMNNSNVATASETRVSVVFRASFNTDYSTFYAKPDDWSLASFTGASHWSPGTMPYVSMNALNRPPTTNGFSYSGSGTVMNTVPGGSADLFVEGMVVSSSGTILARRVVEAFVGIKSAGSLSNASSAAADMHMTLTKSGGTVSVTAADSQASWAVNSGLAAMNDIYLYGVDSASGGASAPPGYSSAAKADLGSASNTFTYIDGSNASTDFTADVAQTKQVKPPAIRQSDLPTQSSPATVNAGTYVVWNGQLYYYATDYDTSKPLTKQDWGQSAANQPPTYKGLNGTSVSIDSANKLQFDNASNTLRVQADVLVNSSPRDSADTSGVGNVQTFSYVVAPNTYDSGGGPATITAPTDSSAVGSAQMQFAPSGTTTPQFRSPGTVTIIGNVVGQGSLVAMGQDGATTIQGDINVVGKSSLDARSDSGVALYAANNLNFLQLSSAQAPQAVPEVKTAFDSQGITPGSGADGTGDTGGTNYTEAQMAVNKVLANAMAIDGQYTVDNTVGKSGTNYKVVTTDQTAVGHDLNVGFFLTDVTVTINGTPRAYHWSGQGKTTGQALGIILNDLGVTGLPPGPDHALSDDDVGALLIGSGTKYTVMSMASSGGSGVWTQNGVNLFVSGNDVANYAQYGVPSSQPTPSPTATPSATPSAGATTTQGALDQTFSGLVYAGGDVNMTNKLGRVSVSGAIAAYGGDPNSQQPGTGTGGNINISGTDISLEYNPSLLGPYSSFFGGEVTLKRNSLTVY
jgi:hypothetical protein